MVRSQGRYPVRRHGSIAVVEIRLTLAVVVPDRIPQPTRSLVCAFPALLREHFYYYSLSHQEAAFPEPPGLYR